MDEKKEINIDCKQKEERIKILENNNFQRFNKDCLTNPKYLRPDELKENILKKGASYQYIDDITKGMTEATYLKKLEDKVKKFTDELNSLKSKTWKDIWLAELDVLEKQLEEGIRTKWQFEDTKYVFN